MACGDVSCLRCFLLCPLNLLWPEGCEPLEVLILCSGGWLMSVSFNLAAAHVPMHQFQFDVFVILCCTVLSPCVCVCCRAAASICQHGLHVGQHAGHWQHCPGAAEADAEHQVPVGSGSPAQCPPSPTPSGHSLGAGADQWGRDLPWSISVVARQRGCPWGTKAGCSATRLQRGKERLEPCDICLPHCPPIPSFHFLCRIPVLSSHKDLKGTWGLGSGGGCHFSNRRTVLAAGKKVVSK